MTGIAARLRQQGALLVVDKPAGWTSFDVVNKIRRLAGGVKVGHTGTLDPEATGVLPLVLGRATRLAALFTGSDKCYRARFQLGLTTDTQDLTGTVLSRRPLPPELDRARLESICRSFVGQLEQIPPMYSAVKVGGRRLYELARQGQEVPRQARKIVIHYLELISFAPPRFEVRIRCSSGTYIRTLGADIGEACGCGATMESLVREASGPFELADAHPLPRVIAAADTNAWDDILLSVPAATAHLPALVMDQWTRDCPPEDYRRALEAARLAAPGWFRVTDSRSRPLAVVKLTFDMDPDGSYTRFPGKRRVRVPWTGDRGPSSEPTPSDSGRRTTNAFQSRR